MRIRRQRTTASSKLRLLPILTFQLLLLRLGSSTSLSCQPQRRQQDIIMPILVECSGYQFSERLGTNNEILLQYVVHANENSPTGGTFSAKMTYEGHGWLGFGISPSGTMLNSLAIVGLPDENKVELYKLDDRRKRGIKPLPKEQQTLINATIIQDSTTTTMSFTKVLGDIDFPEFDLNAYGSNTFLFAYGHDNSFNKHIEKGVFTWTLRPCIPTPKFDNEPGNEDTLQVTNDTENTQIQANHNNSQDTDVGSGDDPDGPWNGANIEAIRSNNSNYSKKHKRFWTAHGILGTLACGVFLPLAIGSSLLRDYYVNNSDEHALRWFPIYQGLNTSLTVVAMIAVLLAFLTNSSSDTTMHRQGEGSTSNTTMHRVGGIVLLVFLLIHTLLGFMRYYIYRVNQAEERNTVGEESAKDYPIQQVASGDESTVSGSSSFLPRRKLWFLKQEEECIQADTNTDSIEISIKIEEGQRSTKADDQSTASALGGVGKCKNEDTTQARAKPERSIVTSFTRLWDSFHCVVGLIIMLISWWHCGTGFDIYQEMFSAQESMFGRTLFWGLTGFVSGIIGLLWSCQMVRSRCSSYLVTRRNCI